MKSKSTFGEIKSLLKKYFETKSELKTISFDHLRKEVDSSTNFSISKYKVQKNLDHLEDAIEKHEILSEEFPVVLENAFVNPKCIPIKPSLKTSYLFEKFLMIEDIQLSEYRKYELRLIAKGASFDSYSFYTEFFASLTSAEQAYFLKTIQSAVKVKLEEVESLKRDYINIKNEIFLLFKNNKTKLGNYYFHIIPLIKTKFHYLNEIHNIDKIIEINILRKNLFNIIILKICPQLKLKF